MEYILKTPRLTLRPLRESDLLTTHAYASDRATIQYMVYLPKDSLDETRTFLESVARQWESDTPEFYEFAILCGDAHIGAISVYFEGEPDECELGWIIHRDWQGHGYATEAAEAVMQFAVETLGCRRVFACCDKRNAASARVMQKLGMTLHSDTRLRRNRGEDHDVPEFIYERWF